MKILLHRLFSPWPFVAAAFLLAASGCDSLPRPATAADDQKTELTLHEGDVIRVEFPGAQNLVVPPATIRRDGKITLPIIGEVLASGFTPTALQTQLSSLYSKQLQSSEVVVTVVSSTFFVFVDGSVGKPGKIVADHPMTVMEAIMESGGFDYKTADASRVMIIRHQGNAPGYTYFTVDLKNVLKGKKQDLFYLAPGDMVHVPEKFSWF